MNMDLGRREEEISGALIITFWYGGTPYGRRQCKISLRLALRD